MKLKLKLKKKLEWLVPEIACKMRIPVGPLGTDPLEETWINDFSTYWLYFILFQ